MSWSAYLYDQIIVPTGNLQVLPVLRLMLGGYAGNGGGIVFVISWLFGTPVAQ